MISPHFRRNMINSTAEITRIATSTTFNGTFVLNTAATITFQVGANAGDIIDCNHC